MPRSRTGPRPSAHPGQVITGCWKPKLSTQPSPSAALRASWETSLHDLRGTPEYDVLCQESAGQPIRHVANNGHGPIAWVAAQEAAYGSLPQLWFADAVGTVEQGRGAAAAPLPRQGARS
ncbi:hypothetical protein [Streptomyces sp. BF23-19]|uniref:hypothetical protein n=1 Tax=unclassified Streptomyces TaxID=2593676 RepID=UPI0034E3E0BB